MDKLKKYSTDKKMIIVKHSKQAESILNEIRNNGRIDLNAVF